VTITLAQLISLVVGTLLPILVAVITDRVAQGAVKAIVLLGLAALTSFLSSWLVALNGGLPFDFAQAAFGVLITFIVAVAVHFGFWKPVNLTGSQGQLAKVGPDSTRGRAG
jgi:hypothetical protein